MGQGKVRWSKTDVLPLCNATNRSYSFFILVDVVVDDVFDEI